MRWLKADLDQELVKTLGQKLEIDSLEAAILVRRGVTQPERLKFFFEDDLRWTHNPFLFNQMEDMVDRILLARDEDEPILVFGDRDTDGITSTVILVECLNALGVKTLEWRVPLGDDPYGLTKRAVDEFAAKEGTLIITVDCGISNFQEIEYARALGIDTLVVDHHEAGSTLPSALAIVNPKVPGERYPYANLAACAVTAKLCWALRFADTEWYNQSTCILNASPADGFLKVEAVKLVNLLEVKRINLEFKENGQGREREALASFLMGTEILVYGAALQTSLLRTIFGRGVDIHLTDMVPQVVQAYPALAGIDLPGLRARSRMVRYQEQELTDLDILISLFTSYFYKSKPGLSQEFLKQLDLVALGTLADMMPLENENRILVRQGLKVLNSTSRTGLRNLILQTKLGTKKLGAQDISWYLTPLINATGRMGTPDKSVRLLLTTKDEEQKSLAREIALLNEDRKLLSTQGWDQFVEAASQSVEKYKTLSFIYSADLPRGITGILSSRFMNMLRVPSLVMSLAGDHFVASLRACRGFETRKFLESFQDLFLDFGGHTAAAGFQMSRERFPEFLERLEKTSVMFALDTSSAEEVINIDAELPHNLMTPEVLMRCLDTLEPYGETWPPLTFSIRRVHIVSAEPLGKDAKHLRLSLQIGDARWPAIRWDGADLWGAGAYKLEEKVDVAFQVQRNYYQGKESLQFMIQDINNAV